jgi:DNA primase
LIPDSAVDEVRARADLVEVVGESVQLTRAGKDWKGKCPFHEDHTPSFYVVPSKGFYNCFGCGASGDVFTFVMKRTGMGFLDAVKALGERYGVTIVETRQADEKSDPHRALYEANAFARDWFRSQLLDPAVGAPARAYLEKRGISAEAAERFELGYAPGDGKAFRQAAATHEISESLLLELGLLKTSERSPEPYDRFRSRVMFPIESVGGRIVGFGGRLIVSGGKAPKYLNSPESAVYHKGSVLYGLARSRNAIRREGVALVVEGYMDLVALGAAGIEHTAATLGTAMTDEHARLLARYTRKALLLFDSDEAGLKATFRAADALLAQGIQSSVVTLPPGEDPDTVVRSEGAEGLEAYLHAAVDVLDRKLQLLDEKGYFRTVDRTRVAVDKLLPTLRATRDAALRDIYVSRVAEKTGVRRETLEAEIARSDGRTGPAIVGDRDSSEARSPGRVPARSRGRSSRANLSRLGAERQLLLILLREREWIVRALERVGPGEFRSPVYRSIFEALAADSELKGPPPGMTSEVAAELEAMLGDPEVIEHAGQAFQDCLARLEDRPLDRQRMELEQDLRAAGSEDEKRVVLEKLDRLRRTRRGRWNVVRREGPVGIGEDDQRMNG